MTATSLVRNGLLVLVALFAVVQARAQGISTGAGFYQVGGCAVYQFTMLSIDSSMDIYAYAETDTELGSDCGPTESEAATELVMMQDGFWIYDSGYPGSLGLFSSGDSQEYYGTSQSGHTYTADGIAYMGYTSYYDEYPGEGSFSYVGDAPASVWQGLVSAGAPEVDSISPASGTPGDSNIQIELDGQNLLNSDGSLPSFTTWPSGLHLTVQSGSNTSLYATYTIDPGTSPTTGLIDVNTDGGISNDSAFQINSGAAVITSLDPPIWNADGNPFVLTISGSGFGSNPAVKVDLPDIILGPGSYSDTMIQVYVTVPASETAPVVNLAVVPDGIDCSVINCFSPGQVGGGGRKPAVSSAAITTNCFAQLKYRAVYYQGIINTNANHAFWWIQDGQGKQWIMDAGPQNQGCQPDCGKLVAWIIAVTPTNTSGHYAADDISAATQWSTGPSYAVCTQVNALEAAARVWPGDQAYSKLGPNSNTFVHVIATTAGFTNVTQPPSTIGW